MTWDVEYMNDFGDWWTELAESEQDEIASVVELLAEHGPGLRFPYSAGVAGFRHGHMRELRVQSAGKPIRVFYAFDPRCTRRRQDGQRAVLQAVRAAGRQALLRALAGTERGRSDRMSGRHAFDELTKGFTPNRRERVDARKAELRAAMPLHELRKARAMTQKAVDEVLKVNQPAVAKLERRADMYVSNLRVYIEAMGGRLSIVAEFPQGSVVITNFSDAGEEAKAR